MEKLSVFRRGISTKDTTLVDPWTLWSKDNRVVTLFGHVVSSAEVPTIQGTPSVAEEVFGALMILAKEGAEPVKIILNSPGGSVIGGLTIIQGMEHLKAKGIEVWTINVCHSLSMATSILAAGTPGRRYALNHAMVHVHSISLKPGGNIDDVEKTIEYGKHLKKVLYGLLAGQTRIPEFMNIEGKYDYPEERLKEPDIRFKLVEELLRGENPMMPEKALEMGLIDKVLMPGDTLIDEIFGGDVSFLPVRSQKEEDNV